jgi:outer membrane protein OmpA-like peptidoglycan-associated protein
MIRNVSNCVILFLIFLDYHGQAQNYSSVRNASKKIIAKFDDVKKLIMQENLTDAAHMLEQLTVSEPEFIDGWLLLGELYKEEGNYKSGKLALEKAIVLDDDYSSKGYFFLAECSWNLDEYEDCKAACEKFLEFPDISKQRKLEAEHLIANCTFAISAINSPVPFEPKNLSNGINTDAPEYLPSLTGDEQTIVFTRRRGSGRDANEDFYQSDKKNNEWSEALPLEGVNSPYNEGAQAMTPDGNTIYFVVCDKPNGFGSCDIYYTQKTGSRWSEPANIGSPVCTNAWESQPSISADGKTLFFISVRIGGEGGSDLWISNKEESGKWSNPVNAGDSINTRGDEKCPFIHPDGNTLYFSTNGHPGMGKDDIFYSHKKSDGTWSKAKNLGYPINTKNDENSFIVSLDGHHAYFSSDRFKMNRDMDLYFFELYKEAQPGSVTYLKGNVTDAFTNEAVGANLQLIDLETGVVSGEAISNSIKGNYLISIPTGRDYALNVAAKGYLFYSENFSLKDHQDKEPFLLNVKMKPIKTGNSVVLKNIFFETDSYTLKNESKAELDRLISLLKENPSMKIEITGHTDNQGDVNYNIELSRNRAKSVYEYLTTQDISQARLAYKGYGESKPVASNDTEDGRSQNRRTEFTVTGL